MDKCILEIVGYQNRALAAQARNAIPIVADFSKISAERTKPRRPD
jgi:hypothetical protein